MTIFDYLNSLLYTKKNIEMNCDEESQFNLFMVNRWVSFYSKDMNGYVNEFCNKQFTCFETKQEQFDLYLNVLPKLKFKKIEYIKKVKKEATEKEPPIIPEFLSQREYNYYVELKNSLSK